jgi:hypothetical protein
MRLWVTALVFLCVGGLLVWLAAARVGEAWPRSTAFVSGAVSSVEGGALAGGGGRMVFRLEGQEQRFELSPMFLAYPTAGHLADAGRVSVDYDSRERIHGSEPVYVVTGLTVDGRVFFTPSMYWASIVLWALFLALPGGVAFALGTLWIYRLSGNPYWRPSKWNLRFARPRAFAFAAPSLRDPRKTASGEWLH